MIDLQTQIRPTAVFLDREGVVTPQLPPGSFVLRSEQAILAPGVPEALRLLTSVGTRLFIVSNQSCVARGLITLEEAQELHRQILTALSTAGVEIVDSVLCPHRDEDGCACRKPLPGMINGLCRRHGIDPRQAAMIGDAPRDMIAARDAGIPRRIMLGTADASEATDRVTTMDEACRLIMPSASSATHRLDRYPEETRAFLQEFQERYRADDVIRRIERIRPLKVLLIGDAVIDEYCYVRPMGKTSKANIIASRILNDEAFIGGIFACANHVAGFCDTVHVVTGLGLTDTKETFIRDHLKTNVTMKAIYRKGVPTTVKRRYVDSNFLAKLFEVYRFDDGALHADQEAELHAYLLTVLPQYDVVICLDYLHGLISSRTVELLASQSAFLAVNTQTNAANIGYNPITRYPNADYICIDEPELRLATLDRFGPIDPLLVSVAERLSCPKAIATRGHHGCLTFEAGTGLQSIPVLSQNVVDAVGAGDAFLAVTAPCAAAGMPMDLVGFIGNIVGSRAVMIVGNRETVDFPSVVAAIHSILA